MHYDFEGLKSRILDIEGGYSAVANEMNVSNQRIRTLLDPTGNPRLSTMAKLNEAIKKLEDQRDVVVKSNPEIFLPSNVIYSPSCT